MYLPSNTSHLIIILSSHFRRFRHFCYLLPTTIYASIDGSEIPIGGVCMPGIRRHHVWDFYENRQDIRVEHQSVRESGEKLK
jgi:hypothetical protein